jgi:hypothetical protein
MPRCWSRRAANEAGSGVMRILRIALAWLPMWIAISTTAVAQPEPETQQGGRRPEYQSLRYEEDWSALRARSLRTDFWDPVKYLPLRGCASATAWSFPDVPRTFGRHGNLGAHALDSNDGPVGARGSRPRRRV